MKNEKIIIRRAESGDIKQIQELNAQLFVHDQIYDGALDNNWPHSDDGEKYFRRAVRDEQYLSLVAVAEKRIVGYLNGYLWKKWKSRPVKTAEIDNMLIVNKFRGSGIGTRLMEEFTDWCKRKKVKSIMVMTYKGNKQAIDFYKKNGFGDLSVRLQRKI